MKDERTLSLIAEAHSIKTKSLTHMLPILVLSTRVKLNDINIPAEKYNTNFYYCQPKAATLLVGSVIV
jgi:hypothetical protein